MVMTLQHAYSVAKQYRRNYT